MIPIRLNPPAPDPETDLANLLGRDVELNPNGTITEREAIAIERELLRITGKSFTVNREHDMRIDFKIHLMPPDPEAHPTAARDKPDE